MTDRDDVVKCAGCRKEKHDEQKGENHWSVMLLHRDADGIHGSPS
jgi:hypothetical protein